MPISTGPGVTQVEAFKEIKDRVSSVALHGAARPTGTGKNGAPMSNKVKGRGKKGAGTGVPRRMPAYLTTPFTSLEMLTRVLAG